MRITDTHVHFWDPRALSYPWLKNLPDLLVPRLPADLDAATAGPVERIVLVEAGCTPDSALAEARWFSALAARNPHIGAVVAAVRLEDEAHGAADLEAVMQLPLVSGVRRNFQDLAAGEITAPAMVAGARATATAGLVFDATVRWEQLDELADFARQLPELTIVLDHLGKPPVAAGTVAPWAKALEQVAACPNVWVKMSGLAAEADPGQPLAGQVRPFLAAALDVADPGRLLLGSDWPVSTARTPEDTYTRWWSLLLGETLAGLTEPEREAAAWGNAERIYMKAGTADA